MSGLLCLHNQTNDWILGEWKHRVEAKASVLWRTRLSTRLSILCEAREDWWIGGSYGCGASRIERNMWPRRV